MTVATSPTERLASTFRPSPLNGREIRITNNPALRAELQREQRECNDTSLISSFERTIITTLLKTGVFRRTSVYIPRNENAVVAFEAAYATVEAIIKTHTPD